MADHYAAYELEGGTQIHFGPHPPTDTGWWSLLYEFEAATWNDAMAEHHRRQGWEPYVPMEDDDA